MYRLFTIGSLSLMIFVFCILTGCSPEVGSEEWCTKMNETPKADWSANMAADYAKHCLFK